jgi:heme exporter protein A
MSEHPTNEAAIVAENVERRFGNFRVLRGLNLTVPRSNVLALFGPNGAGKTTFLKLLAGLASPNGGSAQVFGCALPGDAKLRRRIGVVAHEPYVYADLTARENLDYYARLYRVTRSDRAADLIEQVGLSGAAHRTVRTYSRGMLQRLALARALLHEPDLLLLDEPFTGLDPQGAQTLIELLSAEKTRGTTMIITTHDFDRGLAVADRAAVLAGGKIAWESEEQLPNADEMSAIYTTTVSPGAN